MWMLLVSQLVIQASAPPLTPAEAARVLRSSHSDRDLTDYRAVPAQELPDAVPVVEKKPVVEHKPEFVPLNCCSQYVIPAPHPVVEVIVRKEGR